jgi:hypothetical protein
MKPNFSGSCTRNKLLPKLNYLLSALLLFVVLTGCEKDEPSCTNCPPSPGNTVDSTAIDPRQQYVGRFKVKFIYYDRYYIMDPGFYKYTNDTSEFNIVVSYLPDDSALVNIGPGFNYAYRSNLTVTIQGQNPSQFPYNQFPLVKPGLYNGSMLADASPWNKGGFVNPDSINYEWSDDHGSRDATTKKVYGHRIP